MKTILNKGFLVIGLLCACLIVKGQGRKLSVGIEGSIMGGGDGFGMYLNPALNIGYNSIAVSAGPVIQKCGYNASGFQVKPMYSLSDSGYRKVFVYVYAQSVYNRNVYLSDTYNQILLKLEPEMEGKEKVAFRTFQQYVGVGISGSSSKRVALKAEIGVGGYLDLEREKHMELPVSFEGTRSNSDISLMFSVGVRLNIIKQIEK